MPRPFENNAFSGERRPKMERFIEFPHLFYPFFQKVKCSFVEPECEERRTFSGTKTHRKHLDQYRVTAE